MISVLCITDKKWDAAKLLLDRYVNTGLRIARASITVIFLLVILATASVSHAATKTTVGTVSAWPDTSTSIKVIMPYTGDDTTPNNTYAVKWKLCGAGSYADTINGAHTSSPYIATIPSLTSGECYNIQATYNDVDGVSGVNPQTLKIIAGGSDTTLLHNSNRFLSSTKWSGNWGLDLPGSKYGQITCGTCHEPRATNIKGTKSTIIAPVGTFPGSIVSLQSTNGFGNDSDNHTTSNRICEVCHSITSHHRYNTSEQTDGKSHQNNANCLACHPHSVGFYYASSACDSCHGNPPTTTAVGGSTGLATPATNALGASTDPGAHAKHVTTRSMTCDACHTGTTMPAVSNTIQMGFAVNSTTFPGWGSTAVTNGSFTGTNSLNSPYSWVSSNAGTTVNTASNFNNECSNIYCHGSTMAPNGGTDITPAWDSPSTAACGTCHGATAANPPLLGSHRTHTTNIEWNYAPNYVEPFNNYIYGRNLACTECHNNYTSNHVNGKADWSFDTATYSWLSGAQYKGSSTGTSSPVPGTYGQCTNLYCHSIIQTNTGGPLTGLEGEYKTPTWGNRTEGNCGTCHGVDAGHAYWAGLPDGTPEISTGSHTKHLYVIGLNVGIGGTPGGPGRCAVCHNYTGSDSLLGCSSLCHDRGNLHVNHQIDIKFAPRYGGSSAVYNGNPVPGTGFAGCSNTYCHSNGTSVSTGTVTANTSANWGTEPLSCDGCHGYPPAYANSSPKANSHTAHACVNCSTCHWLTTQTGSTITDYTKHVNRQYDIGNSSATLSYNYNATGGSCSGTFACHGNAQWGNTMTVASSNCIACHNTTKGSRRQIVDSNGDGSGTGGDFIKTSHHVLTQIGNAACSVCHDMTQHMCGNVRLKDADTGAIYTYDPANPATAENFCLSCHDSNGANGNLSPLSDGATLGVVPYMASKDIKSDWQKTYGHRQKGLTCLGNGSPNTGCHSNGHGSDYSGLLASNMKFTTPVGAPFNYDDYKLCLDCHQNYPAVTKEVILGYKQGGNYDYYYAPTPYYTSAIQSKFRYRYANGSSSYPSYWGGVEQSYNDDFGYLFGVSYIPLHNWHMSPMETMYFGSSWNYRGIETRPTCTTCHGVHGSNTESGWIYDEVGYKHNDGVGPDKYSTAEHSDPDQYNKYPTNCAYSCHRYFGPDRLWYEPSNE